MKSTERLTKAIKVFEGLRLNAYKCPAGVWTIGYGHTGRGVKSGMKITQAIADALLVEDIEKVERELQVFNLPKLTENQFDAVVDFCFNLGTAKFSSSTLYKKIKANPNDASIEKEFGRWVYAGGVKLAGLVKRRKWEAGRWKGVC